MGRIDQYLAAYDQVSTRSQAARLIGLGLVTLAGKRVRPSYVPKVGDIIEIDMPANITKLLPYEYPLDIQFEDSDLMVVNKPAGLVTHPSLGHEQDSLVNALLFHAKTLSPGYTHERPGVVHRLDKDTSGLLVVAKNERTHSALGKQFMAKTVHRIYWAITYGHFKLKEGRIETEIKRSPIDRKKFASTRPGEGGRRAVTHYKVVQESSQGITLVHLKLETGRTHQIRVHLSELGHPILGDLVYGTERRVQSIQSKELRKSITDLNRFALHAAELGFQHPETKKMLMFNVDWPNDLQELLSLCKWDSPL